MPPAAFRSSPGSGGNVAGMIPDGDAPATGQVAGEATGDGSGDGSGDGATDGPAEASGDGWSDATGDAGADASGDADGGGALAGASSKVIDRTRASSDVSGGEKSPGDALLSVATLSFR